MKTADGVEIVHGSVVFVPRPWLGHCEQVAMVEGVAMSRYAGTVFPAA